MRIARILVAGILALGLGAQEVVIPRAPLVLAQVPAGQGPMTPATTTTQQPQPKAKKKSSRKTTWIVVGAVAAGAVAGLVVLDRRLGNEGRGIF